MTEGLDEIAPDDPPFTLDQQRTLWLMTADPMTWDLMEAVPPFFARGCADLGLVFEAAPGLWRLTVKGNRVVQRKVVEV